MGSIACLKDAFQSTINPPLQEPGARKHRSSHERAQWSLKIQTKVHRRALRPQTQSCSRQQVLHSTFPIIDLVFFDATTAVTTSSPGLAVVSVAR